LRETARSLTSSIEVPRRLLGACSLPSGWETGDGEFEAPTSPKASLCGLWVSRSLWVTPAAALFSLAEVEAVGCWPSATAS
jgi:hypothetical protein